MTEHDLEHKIRERTYHLWVAEGRREGESDRHWLIAERDLLADFAMTAPATKRPSRKAANTNAPTGIKTPAKIRRRAS